MAGDKPHYYARTAPTVSRQTGTTASSGSTRVSDVDEHGTRVRGTEIEGSEAAPLWDTIDLGGHGLKSMAASLFRHYSHLKKVYFNHNHLSHLTPHISTMRHLTVLDISFNALTELPAEVGMLTSLKRLLLFDNGIDRLPYEIGYLFQLEMLGLEGNPMRDGRDQMEYLVEHGTHELVKYLREGAPRKSLPATCSWLSANICRST